ncbi:MAG: hypothetical protein FWD23_11945 [Oscillospiraceae bacterium]|nr:hypothetical protein [Oscillospiraceae bacterium]
MATETFDKIVWIDEKAAEIMANELEKPKKPFISQLNRAEEERKTQEWLAKYRLKKSLAQKKR